MIKKVIFALVIFSMQNFILAEVLQDKLDAKRASSKAPEEIKAIMASALKDLKDSGIESKGLKAGAEIPDFSVGEVKIKDIYKKQTTVVKFFRGSWCPYCMLELKEYKEIKSKFDQANCQLVILSPDTLMENKKTKDKLGLPFELYADKDNQIAKKFGIAFGLNEALIGVYKKFGIDLDKNQGNENKELPLPGTYVVNKEGKITYAFIDADYTKRANPSEVIAACQKLR